MITFSPNVATNRGGFTINAAIVSRELGVPAIIGTEVLEEGQVVTISCADCGSDIVNDGHLPIKKRGLTPILTQVTVT